MTISSQFYLKMFPFDCQRLFLNIRSGWFHSKQIKFIATEQQVKSMKEDINPRLDLSEWDLLDSRGEIGTHIYPMLQKLEGEDNGIFSNLQISFDLQRIPDYYIAKIVVLFYIIFLMNGGSFFSLSHRRGRS